MILNRLKGISGAVRLSLTLALAVLVISGCSVVVIQRGETAPLQVLPGFTRLELRPDRAGVASVSLTGIGLTLGGHSTTIGFLREKVVMVADGADCRFILFDVRPEHAESVVQVLLAAGVRPEAICTSIQVSATP